MLLRFEWNIVFVFGDIRYIDAMMHDATDSIFRLVAWYKYLMSTP